MNLHLPQLDSCVEDCLSRTPGLMRLDLEPWPVLGAPRCPLMMDGFFHPMGTRRWTNALGWIGLRGASGRSGVRPAPDGLGDLLGGRKIRVARTARVERTGPPWHKKHQEDKERTPHAGERKEASAQTASSWLSGGSFPKQTNLEPCTCSRNQLALLNFLLQVFGRRRAAVRS